MTELEPRRRRLVELLTQLSFERKRVLLASGKESDFFIDCKQTILTAEGHALVGELMFAAVRASFPRAGGVAGVELGGCPLVSAVALVSHQRGHDLPAFYVRKDAKDHGTKKLVEGDKSLTQDLEVVMLEDVVTTGGSTLKAVEKLRAAGARVTGVVALVDRKEGGREAIEAGGLTLVSIATRADFIAD